MNYRAFGIGACTTVLALLLAVPALAQWTTSVSKDEMTGKKSCYAHSPVTGPVEKMGFPYGDTTAWLGIGSDGKSEWVYVGFSDSPNLADTATEDGYNRIRTRIKWDDNVENITLTQDWGAKFIHFTDDKKTISKIAQSNTVLLELNWFGEGKTYFRFSLSGSSAAISKIRSTCGNN